MFRALVSSVTIPFQEILNESLDALSMLLDCAIGVDYITGREKTKYLKR
jgi:hypothetical protein